MAKGSGERGFKALLEDIEAKLRAVAEGHGILVQRSERLEARFGAVEERIGWVEQAVTETNDKLGQLISRFDAYERSHTN